MLPVRKPKWSLAGSKTTQAPDARRRIICYRFKQKGHKANYRPSLPDSNYKHKTPIEIPPIRPRNRRIKCGIIVTIGIINLSIEPRN